MHAVVRTDTKVSDPSLLGSSFSQNGKGSICILNLLLHNAGFPPDPDPLYCEFLLSIYNLHLVVYYIVDDSNPSCLVVSTKCTTIDSDMSQPQLVTA